MSTRACHLELLDDLSTDHFIIALKRFIARRGRLQNIFSDNGTTFAGANNELQQYIGQRPRRSKGTLIRRVISTLQVPGRD